MKRYKFPCIASQFITTLAVIGLVTVAPVRQAQAIDANRLNAQTAEILALLSAVHELTSYNGNPDTSAQHLAAWTQLWAEDATFTINNAVTYEGRDAVMGFFAAAPLFNQDWVGLTPSFRTEVAIHGNTAEVYLECIFLNESKTVVAERALSGTILKINGQWRFWHMNNDPAMPLF